MVRFSIGDEEEEEEVLVIGNKRRNRRVEDENEHKLRRFGKDEDQGGGEELNEEGGGELSEEGGHSEGCRGFENKDGGVSVTIDPDVLECSICCEPLRPPLYQVQIPIILSTYFSVQPSIEIGCKFPFFDLFFFWSMKLD